MIDWNSEGQCGRQTIRLGQSEEKRVHQGFFFFPSNQQWYKLNSFKRKSNRSCLKSSASVLFAAVGPSVGVGQSKFHSMSGQVRERRDFPFPHPPLRKEQKEEGKKIIEFDYNHTETRVRRMDRLALTSLARTPPIQRTKSEQTEQEKNLVGIWCRASNCRESSVVENQPQIVPQV